MVGSLVYASVTFIMLLVTKRALGMDEAGVFSIAFTTGQMMLTIGYFDMRTYQASDISEVFSFNQYLAARILTCTAMIAVSVAFVFVQGYVMYKAAAVLLMCVYKMIDGLADVYEGYFQQKDRLDLAGISLAFRTILSVTVFTVAIFISKQLILASALAIVASAAGFLLFDVAVAQIVFHTKTVVDLSRLGRILFDCLPLFAGSFMSFYVSNATKYSIDSFMPDRAQTIYNILYMPTSVVNLLSLFILKPLLTTLAQSWSRGDKKGFAVLIRKLFLYIVLLTAFTLAGTYFLGIPVLSWFYATDLSAYKSALLVLIFGGGVGALITIWYYALTVIRKQQRMFFGYLIAFILAFVITPGFVKSGGIMGGSIAFLILTAILCLVLFLILCISFLQSVKKEDGAARTLK